MQFKKYEANLSKKSNLGFYYTDKKDSYLKFNVSNNKHDDGFINGNNCLFTDFYLRIGKKKLQRKDADSTVLYSDHFELKYNHFGITISCYLPVFKGSVYFKIENEYLKIVNFIILKKDTVIQEEILFSRENYIALREENQRTVPFFEIQKEIENTEKFYSEIENHFNFDTGIESVNKALYWAQLNGNKLCTSNNEESGIWAGLPWFKENWGRDTFIAIQGLFIVNGFFEEAKSVLSCFIKHQKLDKQSKNYGRIPNRYKNENDVIYNTADGNLWFIKALWQYLQYSGDTEFLHSIWENIKIAVFSDLELRTDEKGFLTNNDSDTWMDARIEGNEPLSARGNRANDIQAFWYEELNIFFQLCEIEKSTENVEKIKETIQKLKKNFKKFFWNEKEMILADRLTKNDKADYKIRANQFFCINEEYCLVDKEIQKKIVKNSFEKLVLPHGVCSLSPLDIDFHPYHDGCRKYHKDAAYHNGAIWYWLTGQMVSSLCKFNWQNECWKVTKKQCELILKDGCYGTLSENANAAVDKRKVKTTGTWSQAWSVSEFTRNFYQDYLGIRPKLLENKIDFNPRIPDEWKSGNADIFVGKACINVSWTNLKKGKRIFTFKNSEQNKVKIKIVYKGRKYEFLEDNSVVLEVEIPRNLEKLHFVKLNPINSYECMKIDNYLFSKIKKEYKNIIVEGVQNE